MEQWPDVCVITQNVDNLHEQAGSTRVVHLHGELMKLRSKENPELIYDINEGWEQSLDERGEDGALLRPHIVFFLVRMCQCLVWQGILLLRSIYL